MLLVELVCVIAVWLDLERSSRACHKLMIAFIPLSSLRLCMC
uniref:Uncharacterized protein n=1 Tax=Zea mays TaxID=4577 RepID=C4J1F3_MAIZE|nr:unknown [Zea mays]